MGNQESIQYKKAIYENQGKYIIPTKVKLTQSPDQQNLIKNIFGVNDPTLLAKSYWAKDNNKQKIQQIYQKQLEKSRRFAESRIRVNNQDSVYWQKQNLYPQKQMFAKSNVTKFKYHPEQQSSKNLSKMPSCSRIAKLKYFEEGNNSASSLKKSNYTKSLKNSSFSKNLQNLTQLTNSRNKSINLRSKSLIKQTSAFKKTKFYHDNKQIILNDITIQNQMNQIFGLSNIVIKEKENSQICEDIKTLRKTQADISTERQFNGNQQLQNNQKSILHNNEICQQTFSRYEQNPTAICHQQQNKHSFNDNLDKISIKNDSQKSCTDNCNAQKFNGITQDSQNESLMKVLKRESQINIDEPSMKSQNIITIQPVIQNVSQILNQNLKNKQMSSRISQSKTNKSIQMKNNEPFLFNLKQAKKYQKLSEISSTKFLKQNKCIQKILSQNHDQYSQVGKQNFKENSKSSIRRLTEYNQSRQFLRNFQAKNNGFLSRQYTQTINDKDSNIQTLKQFINKSPKSINSQKIILTRQQSCAGRLTQTSKFNGNSYSSPFKSKKYDFGKKQNINNHRNQHNFSVEKSNSSNVLSKDSKGNMKNYQLLLKIQSLSQQLQAIKNKQELSKFQSHRYSPVKQEKENYVYYQDEQYQNEQCKTKEKSCINKFSKSTPFKHRSQYFKLRLN